MGTHGFLEVGGIGHAYFQRGEFAGNSADFGNIAVGNLEFLAAAVVGLVPFGFLEFVRIYVDGVVTNGQRDYFGHFGKGVLAADFAGGVFNYHYEVVGIHAGTADNVFCFIDLNGHRAELELSLSLGLRVESVVAGAESEHCGNSQQYA